ncbi:membrane protein [Arsukibacterium sp. MJ3]|uniref:DUF748 domain-containing protein n=1 Tax=Arsukibacterium sp. MJ3 TaxID=1632859 RepID=UPI000627400B|nr:DUF748 domain-containing protein [Arsukibacterium sp. MJ3]KKO48361.1 membrane protein [Arsukibacterium sp. MJ3]
MYSSSLRQFGGYLQTHWGSPRRIRFWLLALVIAYTLLGFLVLPWLVRYLAVNTVQEDFGRELRIASVQANPFTLTLRIDGVALDDIDNQQLLSWDRLFIDLGWSSIINRAWTFKTIRFNKPIIQEERFASGETRFSRLAALPPDQASRKDKPAPLPALRIAILQLEDGVLHFADNLKDTTAAGAGKAKQVSLTLQDIGLTIKDLTLQKSTRFPVQLAGQLAQGGKLAFDGTLQLLPTTALEGNATIDELALFQVEPYLRQFADVRLNSGTLTLSGQIHSDAQQPFAFKGSAGIGALSISEGPNDEPLIGLRRLQTEQLDLRLKEKQIETHSIAVEGLFGRVVIHEDQSTNFGQLVAKPPADAKNSNNSARKNDTDEELAPFSITIESIELTDGALRFADDSLPLPFSTSIHTLNGAISTLSSTSAEPARVKLEGQVAEFGLAHVDGAVHAWHPTSQTNVNLRFRNLQVPEYSPYTVNFAGRKIAGGTMDLDLDYTIDNKQLDGQNNLVLRDLILGEKMASSDAMDLPLNLAIALLQDSNGVIELTLPVTGNVGDPKFNFDKVIRQALGNAIMSAIQAPFSFLASLVGADPEDLGQIEFPQGRADLLPPQRERIAKLRKALNQRPALVLELAGPFSRVFDGPALQRQKAIDALRQRLAEVGLNVAAPSLTTESNQDMVETMFTTYYQAAGLADAKARFTEKQNASSNGTGFDALAYRNHLAERVIAAQTVTNVELEAIANARASAARDALINQDEDTGIAANRVRLLKPREVNSVDGERIAIEVAITVD